MKLLLSRLLGSRSRRSACRLTPAWAAPRTRPVLEALDDRCVPTTILVTTASDAANHVGTSLRDAILQVNANTSTDPITIRFTLGSSSTIIHVTGTPLPTIRHAQVVLDGGTVAPGAARLIALEGAQAGANADGLSIGADDCTVQALAIYGFTRHGIAVVNRARATLKDDFIGLSASGQTAVANGADGVWL